MISPGYLQPHRPVVPDKQPMEETSVLMLCRREPSVKKENMKISTLMQRRNATEHQEGVHNNFQVNSQVTGRQDLEAQTREGCMRDHAVMENKTSCGHNLTRLEHE